MAALPEGVAQETFDYLLAFTIAHEGDTPFMYNNWPLKNARQDVTAGIGLAIPDEAYAASDEIRGMFVVKATGEPASPDDMRREFRRVAALPRTPRNLFSDYQARSPLQMDRDAMLRSLFDKMLQFWSVSGAEFPDLAEVPAQAQAALLSYNYGLRLRAAPRMCQAVRDGDYATAADESRISGWDARKNEAHRVLFLNAQAIVDGDLDLGLLPPMEGPFKPPPAL
jgi:hypothetical protein